MSNSWWQQGELTEGCLKSNWVLEEKREFSRPTKKKVQTMVVILYWMSAKWYALCYIFYTDHFSCNCYNSPIRHVLEYPFYMKKLRIKDRQSLVQGHQTSTYLKLESIYNFQTLKPVQGKQHSIDWSVEAHNKYWERTKSLMQLEHR